MVAVGAEVGEGVGGGKSVAVNNISASRSAMIFGALRVSPIAFTTCVCPNSTKPFHLV